MNNLSEQIHSNYIKSKLRDGFPLTSENREWLIKKIEKAELIQYLESRLAFEQGVTSNLQSKIKRYQGVVTQAISDLENECLWDALVKLKALESESE